MELDLTIASVGVTRVRPHPGRRHQWVFVTVTAEDGTTGIGEASDSLAESVCVAAVIDLFAPRLLGRKLDVADLRRRMARLAGPSTPIVDGLPLLTAVSGIEQAVWDLVGKVCGRPVCELFGGAPGPVELYANLNRGLDADRSATAVAAAAAAAREAGFRSAKIAPFDGVRPFPGGEDWQAGADRVRAATTAIPTRVDCHGRFTVADAIAAVDGMADLDLLWLEDPLWWADDPEAVAEVRAVSPWPIASGELEHGVGFYRRLAAAVDVVMTDVMHCGGLAAGRQIAEVCTEAGRPLSLHSPAGPVVTAASAHLLRSLGSAEPLEYPYDPDRPAPAGGTYTVDDSPGLGVDIDLAALGEVIEQRKVTT